MSEDEAMETWVAKSGDHAPWRAGFMAGRAAAASEYRQRIEALRALGPVLESQCPTDREYVSGYNAGRADVLAALASPASEQATLADGTANDCRHDAASGVDTAPFGPDKVWRCDHCGLRWRQGGEQAAPTTEQRPVITPSPADWAEAYADDPDL